jgi:hypothetical protein
MANAERVKDAAEAYRYDYLLVYDLEEVANRVEGAMASWWLPSRLRSLAAASDFLPFRSLRRKRSHQQRRSS